MSLGTCTRAALTLEKSGFLPVVEPASCPPSWLPDPYYQSLESHADGAAQGREHPALTTHIQHLLPGLRGLDARQEPEQQVHDGRRSYVLHDKVHKVTFLLQEIHNLEENSHN